VPTADGARWQFGEAALRHVEPGRIVGTVVMVRQTIQRATPRMNGTEATWK
jgi:hypothetical protein